MTRKQIQKEIAKQFKRRIGVSYGRKWRELWDFEVRNYDSNFACDLMTVIFRGKFTVIEIVYDNYLNTSIRVTGETELTSCLRPFMDVAEDITHYINSMLAWHRKDKILWQHKNA